MDSSYQTYPDFSYPSGPTAIPVVHDPQFYSCHDPDAMIPCMPLQPTPTHTTAKAAFLGPTGPWPYSNIRDGHWSSPSPFEASETQSSHYMSSPPLSLDDSVSTISSHESYSPAPYPDPQPVAHFERGPGSVTSEPVHPALPIRLQSQPQYHPQSPSDAGSPIFHDPCHSYTVDCRVTTSASNSSRNASTTSKKGARRTSRQADRVSKRDTTQKQKEKATRRRSNTAPRPNTRATKNKKSDNRVFECCFSRYGCTSSFPSKNEWKRHVSSQHIQLGFYRCDTGRCSQNSRKAHEASPGSDMLVNDFNRKDLFMQHQRRMHAPWVAEKLKAASTDEERKHFELVLEEITNRCWHQQRHPPLHSQCGFCHVEFKGQNAWKERMEHVARHYEQPNPGREMEDPALRDWAIENRVIQWEGSQLRLTSLCRKV